MKGFTLIEMLVYLGLVTLIMAGVTGAALSIRESNGRDAVRALIAEEGLFLLAKIDQALEEGKEETLVWDAKEETLSRMSDPGEAVRLNGGNVRVSAFSLEMIPAALNAPAHTNAALTLAATSSSGALLRQQFTTTYYAKP
ncbi:MAG: prepilin-type N-terminal cleavage/methylation domain-containing protein [bacterium]